MPPKKIMKIITKSHFLNSFPQKTPNLPDNSKSILDK